MKRNIFNVLNLSKRMLLLLFFLTSLTSFPQGRWERIESPTNSFLRRITASDTNTIWASGHNGTIIKSTNQGLIWNVLQTNTNNIIINHSAVNNQLVFALTWELENPPYGTKIISTTDGGNSWQSRFFPIEYEYLQSIYFFNENLGIAAGSRTYLTSNGGLTWVQAQRDSDIVANLPFLDIKMLSNNYGFACGGFIDVAGVIWKTTNGGTNWKTNGISPDEVFDMVILDSLTIIALAGDPEFIYNLAFVKTTDGGESWSYEELPLYAVSFGIDAKDSNNIWSACGYKFIYSTNRGNNWLETETPDSSSVYDLVFINNSKGFACGENGVLLKYISDENSVRFEEIKPDNFILYQNYPNPISTESISGTGVNPGTTISWQSAIGGWQTIKLYDVLGREIETIMDGHFEAGKHSTFYIINSTLPSGVYFYQLRVVEPSSGSVIYVDTKKMVLMK